MKKIVTLFCAILLAFGFTSCGNKNGLSQDQKILLEGENEIAEMVEISKDEFQSMLEAKEDFVIMLSQKGCAGCAAFKPLINDLVGKTDSVIYLVETLVTDLVDYKYTPTLAFIKAGEVVEKSDPTTKAEVFEKYNELEAYISSYAIYPSLLEINVADLRSKIVNNESFVIYYAWDSCSDCTYMHFNFLDDYQRNYTKEQKYYYIETSEWRKDGADTEIWKAFAAEFKIDSYRGGKIPTFQYYEQGELAEMAVYLNDSIGSSSDEVTGNVTLSVTGCFYENAEILGKEFKGSSFAEAYSAYKDGVKAYHNAKLKKFLDTNLAKV